MWLSVDTAGSVLLLSEKIDMQSGLTHAGVKGAQNGSISLVCNGGWMRSRRGTMEDQWTAHNVGRNTASCSPKWVSGHIWFKSVFDTHLVFIGKLPYAEMRSFSFMFYCYCRTEIHLLFVVTAWLNVYCPLPSLPRTVGLFPRACRQGYLPGQSIRCNGGSRWDRVLVGCHLRGCDSHAGTQSSKLNNDPTDWRCVMSNKLVMFVMCFYFDVKVVGHKKGLFLMERADPVFLLMGLPTIPIMLVLGKMIRWEEYLLTLWHRYSGQQLRGKKNPHNYLYLFLHTCTLAHTQKVLGSNPKGHSIPPPWLTLNWIECYLHNVSNWDIFLLQVARCIAFSLTGTLHGNTCRSLGPSVGHWSTPLSPVSRDACSSKEFPQVCSAPFWWVHIIYLR